MVSLTHIVPCPVLTPFVRHYQLLEFNTSGNELTRPWLPIPENHLSFFLEDRPLYLKNDVTGYYVEGSHDVGLVGQATQFNGLMRFNGNYRCFLIMFTPNGFTRLFRHPMFEINNKIYDANGLLGQSSKELLDKLQNSNDIQEMAGLADEFLKGYMKKQKGLHLKDGISFITKELFLTNGGLSPKEYAELANMSLRNFERKFKDMVGVSPKFYCRMLQFEETVMLKTKSPQKDWESIAVQCGYHDAMHLVKEYKEFAGASPSAFFSQSPPPPVKKIFLQRTNY